MIYSGRRESIRTKGEFFYAEIYRQETAFVSHDFILRILHHLHPDEMSSRLLCGNESDALSQGAGAKSYDEWMEQLNASYGLDKPIVLGFVTWAGDALKGNFGDSWKYTVPVLDKFKEVIWLSFVMGAISFVLQLIIAIPLGVVAATKQYSRADYLITAGALMGISLPTFFFATLLKLLFSVKLGWFDLYGLVGRNYAQLDSWGQLMDKANHPGIAIVTLVIVSVGSLMRYTRTNMLEVLNADYIRTARAKGLSEKKVIYHHAFRNTLIPLVTVVGGSLPGLFSGALITETLFAIPGIGLYLLSGDGVRRYSVFHVLYDVSGNPDPCRKP